MTLVKFSFQDEYIDELRLAKLEKPIVRLTNLQRQVKTMPLRSLFVISTAKEANGDIIKLEQYCGQLWNIDQEDKKVWDRVQIIHEHIKEACEALKLEVRAGIYEEGV